MRQGAYYSFIFWTSMPLMRPSHCTCTYWS